MEKPPAQVRTHGELSLSGAALTELMTAVLAEGKAFRFRAGGWSMSPFVKDGDVITVAPLSGREPGTGAIVAFLHPRTGRVAVHRVVRSAPGRYLIRGDNTDGADGALPAGRIIGIVAEVVRNGKRVPGVRGRSAALIAWLSRTGGLDRGLGLLRAIRGRSRKGAA
jgi:hypothetical protein